jgi:hypothetical protein
MNSWGATKEVEKPKSPKFEQRQRLSTGNLLHVAMIDGEWEVWLNTDIQNFDGLCIGAGKSRDAAVTDAVAVLEAATDALQNPPK